MSSLRWRWNISQWKLLCSTPFDETNTRGFWNQIPVFSDNTIAINPTKNPIQHSSKHIDDRHKQNKKRKNFKRRENNKYIMKEGLEDYIWA